MAPAGRYAHFVHRMADGGFSKAFAQVNARVQASGTAVGNFDLQHYGPDFDPTNDDSILHIYIPLA